MVSNGLIEKRGVLRTLFTFLAGLRPTLKISPPPPPRPIEPPTPPARDMSTARPPTKHVQIISSKYVDLYKDEAGERIEVHRLIKNLFIIKKHSHTYNSK